MTLRIPRWGLLLQKPAASAAADAIAPSQTTSVTESAVLGQILEGARHSDAACLLGFKEKGGLNRMSVLLGVL